MYATYEMKWNYFWISAITGSECHHCSLSTAPLLQRKLNLCFLKREHTTTLQRFVLLYQTQLHQVTTGSLQVRNARLRSTCVFAFRLCAIGLQSKATPATCWSGQSFIAWWRWLLRSWDRWAAQSSWWISVNKRSVMEHTFDEMLQKRHMRSFFFLLTTQSFELLKEILLFKQRTEPNSSLKPNWL